MTMSPAARVAARVIAIALPAAGAGFGLVAPHSLLWGATAWLGFLLAALAGWGHLAGRALRVDVTLDLRLAWGTAALLGAAGWLYAFGACDRNALLVLLAVGFGGYVWRHATEPEPAAAGILRGLAGLRRDPQAAILWTVLAALFGITVLGAVARLHGNHFDDDVAYTPLVRRLLQTGDLDEPFSFRRLSSSGGQTILSALGAVRGELGNIFLVDQGVFRIVTFALVIGLLRRQGPADRFVAGAILLMLLVLPDASINTASYWTGTTMFLAMYRTALEVDRARGALLALGALAAAACSLRQNYLPPAVVFPALVLVLRRADRRAWRDVIAAGTVVLVPYMIASWREIHTVMWPLMVGTGNEQVATQPATWSVWQELQMLVRISMDPNPVRVLVPLLPVLLLCRDRRRGAPLLALTGASVVGYVLLVHAFAMSDARNLWRYAFAYMTPLAVIVMIEVAGRGLRPAEPDAGPDDPADAPADARGVHSTFAARVIVLVCVLAQYGYSLKSALTTYKTLATDLDEAHRDQPATSPETAAVYARLQASVPAGAPLVALLDEPAYLDYTRNRVYNLDTPGFASLPPGLPMFAGAEAKADYLRSLGLRHLAFVRGDHSRYFYRRDYWLERFVWDIELWRMVAGYQLDLADDLAELATRHRVIFDEGGMVVLELPPGRPDAVALKRARRVADEPAARWAFMRRLAEREDILDIWTLTSRGDLVFEDGFSRAMRVARNDLGEWEQVTRTTERDRGLMVRWINRSNHLRLRGAGDMQLRIRGHVAFDMIFARPRVSLTVAGHEMVSRLVEPNGTFDVDVTVPAAWLTGWTDAYLHLSTVGEPWRDAAVTRVARVESVDWEPVRR